MKRIAEAKANPFCSDFTFRLPVRQDLHLARKVWHMGMGFFIIFCYLAGELTQSSGALILAGFLVVSLLAERLRLRNSALNQKMLKFWGPIMRSHEVRHMSTVPHYICAAMLAVGIFPKPIAVLSILYLACGDPIASFFGILYGHHGPRVGSTGKSWVGTFAGITACALVTLVYLKSQAFPDDSILILTAIGGLAGGMAELLPFEVDDNFTIPVVSGFVLWLAFIWIGL